MSTFTHGSIAEDSEREALKEHIAGLIAENKRLCEQIETLKVNEGCINKSKEYAFEDLRACQAREAKLREALEKISTNGINWYASIKDAEAALKAEYERGYDCGFLVGAEKGRNFSEEIKQAKREVLREAANAMAIGAFNTPYGLRRMAKEMK